jgi:hypothetical protein
LSKLSPRILPEFSCYPLEPRVDQAAVGGDGIAVGHAGHVVGDGAGAARRPALGFHALRAEPVFVGHQQQVVHERLEHLLITTARALRVMRCTRKCR